MRRMTFKILALLLLLSSVFCDPVLLTVSPTGYPGDVVRISGVNFGSDPQPLLRSVNNGNFSIELPVLSYQLGSAITTSLPANLTFDAYHITLESNNAISNQLTINQPQIYLLDMSSVNIGMKFQIYGKNLYFEKSPLSPTVTFIPPSGTNLVANVDLNQSDHYSLTVMAPSNLVNNEIYTILVDNGYYSAYSPDTMIGRVGTDIFDAGVGWALDFANFTNNIQELSPSNNSSADDSARLVTALSIAQNAGGGIVKLAAGDYYWRTCNKEVPPRNWVVQGAGRGKTTIHFGYCTSPALMYSFGQSLVGWIDLTFSNKQTDNNITLWHNYHGADRILTLRVEYDLGTTRSYGVGGSKILIKDVQAYTKKEFPMGSGYSFGCSTELIFENAYLYWEAAAISFDHAINLVIRNSTFVRDMATQVKYGLTNSRGIAVNYAQRFAFMNNFMESINTNYTYAEVVSNDGETLLSEGGGPKQGDQYLGNVSFATAYSLVDSSMNFPANLLYRPSGAVHVTIIEGPGLGQVRKVIGAYSNGTLQISTPWAFIPTSTSRYAVSIVTHHWLVKGNHFVGFPKAGPFIYVGRCSNFTSVGNFYNNSASALITPHTRKYDYTEVHNCSVVIPYNHTINVFGFVYDIYLIDNVMYVNNPALSIGFGIASQTTGLYSGTLVYGFEARNNSMVRSGTVNSKDYLYIVPCGVNAVTNIVGAISQGNSFVNTQGHAISKAVYGSVVACNSAVGLIGNMTAPGCSSTSNSTSEYPDLCRSSSIKWVPDLPSTTEQPVSVALKHEIINLLYIAVIALLLLM